MISPLTSYETRVLLWVANGNSFAKISDIECRTESSIKRAMERARFKTGTKTTAQLLAVALKYRWLRPEHIYHDEGRETLEQWAKNIARIVSMLLLVTVTFQEFYPFFSDADRPVMVRTSRARRGGRRDSDIVSNEDDKFILKAA